MIDFRYIPVVLTNGEDSVEIQVKAKIEEANSKVLPSGIISKVIDEFYRVNPGDIDAGCKVLIPILPPFHKKHEHSIPLPTDRTVTAKKVDNAATNVKAAGRSPQPPTDESGMPPIEQVGGVKVRLYPYTFSRPSETVEAVIRLYNDMNVSRPIINKLVYEFSNINKDAVPPRLGQTVMVPVLLPFCYRHENSNKIFTDEQE